MTKLATVTQTWIYPVKGMQGICMDEIYVKSISVIGDRRIAFTDSSMTGKSNLVDTIKLPSLLHYVPYLLDSDNPKTSEIIVKAPTGKEYQVNDPALAREISDALGRTIALLSMGRGAYHSMPVSLISEQSMKEINTHLSFPVDPRAYRQNIYISLDSDKAYEEDTWIGKQIQFGDRADSARLMVIKPDERCATITMNPETGLLTPDILKAVVKHHNNTLGVYCTIIKEGTIRIYDPIYFI